MNKLTLNSKTAFYGMSATLASLIVLAIGLVVLGNNFLTEESNDLAELKLENKVLEEQKLSLIQARQDVEQYADLKETAQQIVPQDKDQAKTVRELIKIGQAAGIDIASITFPSSSLGGSSTNGAPVPQEAVNSPLSQLEPVEDIKGVYQLEINLAANGTVEYPKLISFLERLESNRRTAQVTDITVTPNLENRNLVEFSSIINVYIKP